MDNTRLTDQPVYISGKITGTNDYRERFQEAVAILRELGWEKEIIINPVHRVAIAENWSRRKMGYQEMMDYCLFLLSNCQVFVRLPGWDLSPGAQRENAQALKMGIVIADLLPESRQIKLAGGWLAGGDK